MLKNEKGFAISAIIYSLIILFLVLILLTLSMLSSRKVIIDKQKTDVLNKINGSSESKIVYKESILNGSYPVIYNNLIAVTIEDDGTVKKADTSKEWYNYSNKRWANAVILTGVDTYNPEDIIPEENIESYFVWIPKYSYKLWDLGNYSTSITNNYVTGNAQNIDIRFGTDNTSDLNDGECTTPQLPGKIGNCKIGDYMTHPAFITMDTTGLWVGKFETSGSIDKATIKSNSTSLRNIDVKTMFETSYNYNRDLDSHMMKNTEWASVAYLSHSNYGINKEINVNNNSSYLTGYSSTQLVDQSGYKGVIGIEATQTLPYNTTIGYTSSSTGNITGIYDLSGGAFEYMASYINGNLGSSGFNFSDIQSYDKKYFDVYPSESNINSYNFRILGDAVGELGPFNYYSDELNGSKYRNSWYYDRSNFISSDYPWITRGDVNYGGIVAGQFSFDSEDGLGKEQFTFRIVLTP